MPGLSHVARVCYGVEVTVAAFLLECETCHEGQGLLTGVVESFICWRCAADKVFGPTVIGGKDGSPVTAGAKSTVSSAPVPANPVPSPDPLPKGSVQNDVQKSLGTPSTTGRTGTFFACRTCGRVDAPWRGAQCPSCFRDGTRSTGRIAGGPRP